MANPPPKVQILDTTLRDGEQTQGVAFAPQEKLAIAQFLLQRVRVDRIEVASARVSQGEKQAVAKILAWATAEGHAQKVEVLGFVDGEKSVDWIRTTGGRVINLLAKGSEKHCRQQLRKSQEDHLADVQHTLAYAHSQGLATNVYLEDWSNGYQDSPDYVFRMVEVLQNHGVGHFMLPDTLGVMTPDQVYASIADMVARFPGVAFDFHPHNDYGLATANALMAVKAGAAAIHCTVNCLGERAGNASLAEVAVNLKDRFNAELTIDEEQMVSIGRLVETFSGKRVADNAPIVGDDVFTQTAGIHADGDSKGGLYHSPLTPERFARRRTYALGKLSGRASLAKNLEELNISLSPEEQKQVLQHIIALGDSKKIITSEDLPFIVSEVLQRGDYEQIALLDCVITSAMELETNISTRVRFGEEALLASGSGNGGFDAFMSAMEPVMAQRGVVMPKLVDYEVRIPRGGETDALTECFIGWESYGKRFRTRGVHSNQVFASIRAAIRMFNLILQKEDAAGAVDDLDSIYANP